ncbi:MAG TPA: hypothetical protein DCW90_13350 [Lachnospiraceae bacterium]|nr:hypothetical protein [Lachnospiraceae bacterium]
MTESIRVVFYSGYGVETEIAKVDTSDLQTKLYSMTSAPSHSDSKYYFVGWSFGGIVLDEDTTIFSLGAISGTVIELHANWSSYSIVYKDYKGIELGSAADVSPDYKLYDGYTKAIPELTGCKFLGWSYNGSLLNPNSTVNNLIAIAGNNLHKTMVGNYEGNIEFCCVAKFEDLNSASSKFIAIRLDNDVLADMTGEATATAEDVLEGKVVFAHGQKIVGTIPSKSESVITPTAKDQVIEAGCYLAGAQTIKGDSNLRPENIRAKFSIMGVKGVMAPGSYEVLIKNTDHNYWSKLGVIPDGTPVTYDNCVDADKIGELCVQGETIHNDVVRQLKFVCKFTDGRFVVCYLSEDYKLYVATCRFNGSVWEFGDSLLIESAFRGKSFLVSGELVGDRVVLLVEQQRQVADEYERIGVCAVLDLDGDRLFLKNSYTICSNKMGYTCSPLLVTEYGLCIFEMYGTYYYCFVQSDGTITSVKADTSLLKSGYRTGDIWWAGKYIIQTCYDSVLNMDVVMYTVLDKLPTTDAEREGVLISQKYISDGFNHGAIVTEKLGWQVSVVFHNEDELYYIYNCDEKGFDIGLTSVKFIGSGFEITKHNAIKHSQTPIKVLLSRKINTQFVHLGVVRTTNSNMLLSKYDTVCCFIDGDSDYDIVPYSMVEKNNKSTDSNVLSYFPSNAEMKSDSPVFPTSVYDNYYLWNSGTSYYIAPMGNIRYMDDGDILLGVTNSQITPANPGKITVCGI